MDSQSTEKYSSDISFIVGGLKPDAKKIDLSRRLDLNEAPHLPDDDGARLKFDSAICMKASEPISKVKDDL